MGVFRPTLYSVWDILTLTSEKCEVCVKTNKVGEPFLHSPPPEPVLHIDLIDDMAHRMRHSPKPLGGLQLHCEGHALQEDVSWVWLLLPAGGGVQGF